jgi:hypothetical protein
VRTDWPLSRLAGLAVLLLVTAFAAPGEALGAGPPKPPPDTSAIDQYIEVVPTGGGGSAGGVGAPKSKSVSKRIGTLLSTNGGKDAATLRAVVSSSAYGAPQQQLQQTSEPEQQAPAKTKPAAKPKPGSKAKHASKPKPKPKPVTTVRATPGTPSALSAAFSASAGGGSHAFWLLAIILVTTLGALVTAGLRQRARRY